MNHQYYAPDDIVTGCVRTISNEHNMIHQSLFWHTHYLASGVAAGASIDLCISARDFNNNVFMDAFDVVHLKDMVLWVSDQPWEVQIVEVPAWRRAVAPVAVTGSFHNRGASITCPLWLHTNPDFGAGVFPYLGEVFDHFYAGGASAAGPGAGATRDAHDYEFILNTGPLRGSIPQDPAALDQQGYLIRLTNNSAAAADLSLRLYYYMVNNS